MMLCEALDVFAKVRKHVKQRKKVRGAFGQSAKVHEYTSHRAMMRGAQISTCEKLAKAFL